MLRTVSVACAIALWWGQIAGAGQTAPDGGWQALDTRVVELYEQGDLPKAIDTAQAALRAAATPRQSGQSLDRLGFLYHTSGNLAEAETLLRQSLQVRQTAFGLESLDYAETANDAARLLRDLRQLDEAKRLAEQSVATRQRILGEDDLLLAESLNTLATVQGLGGEYETAVSTFERAMTIHELRPAPARATEEYGTLCVNLAGTYQRLGRYAQAGNAFDKGLGALRVKPGISHPAYAVSLLADAALKVDVGSYVEAERLYQEGGALLKEQLGEQHPLYATFLNNRGFLFQSIGNVAAADADYRASLALKNTLYGPGSSQAASTLRNLAHLTYPRNHPDGERLFAEAVAVYARSPNAPSFDYASVLLGLAGAQRDRGAFPEAHATLLQVLEVARQGLGGRHALVASAVRDLGLVDAAVGNDEDAERHLREAVGIAEEAHGENHPDLTTFLDALAGYYARRGNGAAALPLFRRSLEIEDRFLSDVLEIGSESVKTASIAAVPDPVPALIAFQARVGAQIPGARALAFEAVTRRKGRLLDQVRTWRQRLRDSGTPAIRRQLDEWQAMLECRASLTVALGYRELKPSVIGPCDLRGSDLEGRFERLLSDLRTRRTEEISAEAIRAIGVLTDRGDAIEASLNRETSGLSGAAARPSVEAMSRALDPDELLIEFVSYDRPPDEGSPGRRYGAFILDSRGTLSWCDVGPAAPIDASVRDLLTAANDWSLSVRNREGQATRSSARTAQDAVAGLSTRVWAPLQPLLDAEPAARRLRIAPDAMLNLVPFDALSDGHDLIERFAITYLPAGRDLAAQRSADRTPSAPVVMVSPGAGESRDRRRHAAATAVRTGTLTHLPDAAEEAAVVRRIVPGAALYAAANATESRLKGLHGPALLHIVGHGVIRGDDDCDGHPCLAAGLTPAARAMSLSAIVLEEAYGRGAASFDDGLLTPLELQNVDLRGTEMLVLSQCQMANGLASVGEGVYGMRRAAAIAGAETFVAPLWNVADSVQRTLMTRFYTGLAAGQKRSDALRQAKLQLRRSPATSSFLDWAPVILSGSAASLPASLFHPVPAPAR